MVKLGLLAAAAAVAMLTPAGAQDVYYDADVYDRRAYIEEPAYVDQQAIDDADDIGPDDGVIVGPRVYGYTYELRPEDCGTFKYWNGEYCADARFEPPRND